MFTRGKPLTQITSLNLSRKDLKDIPNEIFECTNLRKLNLSNNSISRIPLEISSLRKLEVLNLTGNKLTQLHGGLFRLIKLKRLILANNNIKSIPKQMEKLIKLEVLMIQNNKINNITPDHLSQKIRKLNISNNNITDISWIKNFTNLKQIWIGGNQISKTDLNVLLTNKETYPYKIYHKTKEDFKRNNDDTDTPAFDEYMENTVEPHPVKETEKKVPIACISYTWDDEPHKKWVLNLANKLRDNGIETLLDRYHLRLGSDKNKFMEDMIAKSDRVLVILTPNYKNKADNRIGGAGYEYSLITSEVFKKQENSKFIPILRKGTIEESSPRTLESKIAIFMREGDNFDEQLEELCREIHNEPKIKPPKVGPKPKYE